jgi:ribosomal protein L40E
MGTFPEAHARLYESVYVCRRCEAKIKLPINKFLAGKGVCRKCSCKNLRIVRSRSKK